MSKSATSAEARKGKKQLPLLVAILPSLILYVAAVVLVAMSLKDMTGTVPYWTYFIPAVAFISLLSGWGQAYLFDRSRFFYLIKQIIHWGALFGLLWLIGQQGIQSALSPEKFSLLQLYLLALVALLAGMYLDSKMIFFGAFMTLCAYLLADPANSAILDTLAKPFGMTDASTKPLTMIIIAAVIGFVASAFILIGMRGGIMAKNVRTGRS